MEYFSSIKLSKIDLSIIVPMYNVEDYILETLNSLRGIQGLNAELILVNDGSTDNTLNVAAEWSKRSTLDIIILDKNNEGLSVARNVGTEKARGEIVAFLDSDDIALSYLYGDAIKSMQAHGADLLVVRGATFDHVTQDVYEFPDYYVWNKIMGGSEFKVLTAEQEPRLARLEPNAAVKLYRKKFLVENEISFPEYLLFEDISFYTKCVLNAKKIALLNKTLLLYRVNRCGQITSSFGKKREDILKVVELTVNEYANKKASDDVWANIVGLLIRMTVWCGQNCAHEDKANFMKKAIVLLTQIPDTAFKKYMNKYAYNNWEVGMCKAFIEKDEKTLALALDGGYPVDPIVEEGVYHQHNHTLESLHQLNVKVDRLISHNVILRSRTILAKSEACRKLYFFIRSKMHKG